MPKSKTTPTTLLLQLDELRAQKTDLEKQIKKVQKNLVTMLEKSEDRGVELEVEGGVLRGAYVKAEKMVWTDIPKFRGGIAPDVFERVIKISIDNDRVEEEVKQGNIHLDLVEACTEVKEAEPYIRISFQKA